MVAIYIAKGQGLTQALKSYAQSQNIDTTNISANDWYKTIDKLKELQQKRQENNQESIYSGSNMLVHVGYKNFSDDEINALFETMGLKVQKTQQAEEIEDETKTDDNVDDDVDETENSKYKSYFESYNRQKKHLKHKRKKMDGRLRLRTL